MKYNWVNFLIQNLSNLVYKLMLIDIDIGKIGVEAAIYLFLAFFIGLSQVRRGLCRPQG